MRRLFYLKREIGQIQMQIDELTRLKAAALQNSPKGGVKKSPVESYYFRLDDLRKQLHNKINKYAVECKTVENFVEEITEDDVRLIARMRYIDNYGWRRIGRELHMDRTTAQKKLKRYLNGIETKES